MKVKSEKLRVKNNGRAGFTLIEILVVMGIMTVLTGLGLLVSIDFYKSYAFNSERDTIVSILQKARSQSLSNINQAGHGVHIDANNYVIFEGVDYISRHAALDQAIPVYPGITVPNLDIIFAQLSGDSSSLGPINITDGKRSAVISLNSEGQINW